MADETDLTIQILRQIQSDLAEIKGDLAGIKGTLGQHGLRLDTHSDNFADIAEWMREIRGLLKDYAIAQELRRTMTDLVRRVQALESLRQ